MPAGGTRSHRTARTRTHTHAHHHLTHTQTHARAPCSQAPLGRIGAELTGTLNSRDMGRPRWHTRLVYCILVLCHLVALCEARRKKKGKRHGKKMKSFKWIIGVLALGLFGPALASFTASLYRDPAVPKLIRATMAEIQRRATTFLGTPAPATPADVNAYEEFADPPSESRAGARSDASRRRRRRTTDG